MWKTLICILFNYLELLWTYRWLITIRPNYYLVENLLIPKLDKIKLKYEKKRNKNEPYSRVPAKVFIVEILSPHVCSKCFEVIRKEKKIHQDWGKQWWKLEQLIFFRSIQSSYSHNLYEFRYETNNEWSFFGRRNLSGKKSMKKTWR